MEKKHVSGRKKVLFINLPCFCVTDKFRDTTNPPLNIAYLISALKESKIESDVLDLFIYSLKKYGVKKHNQMLESAVYNSPDKKFLAFLKKKLIAQLKKEDYFLVGINGDLFKLAFFMFREVKKINPKIKTVVGGNMATHFPGTFLDKKNIDFISLYESETNIKELGEALIKGKNLNRVHGIYYKDNGSYIKTALPKVDDVNKIATPDFSKFDMKEYLKINGNRLAVITARGCRAFCSFCGIAKISRVIRVREAEKFVDEIMFLKDTYNVKYFTFYNAMMNLTSTHITSICEELLKRGVKIKWGCHIRADRFIDEDILDMMKKAGCESISVGIETGSKKVSTLCNKGIDLNFAKRLIDHCKKIGLLIRCSFMFNIPKENFLDFLKTIYLIFKYKLDIVTINQFAYDAGSLLYKDIAKYNDVYSESIFDVYDYRQMGIIFWIKQKIVNFTLNYVNLKKISLKAFDM